MGLIRGENISLYINGGLMSCWRSSSIDITADTIGKSTVGSGNWKEFEGVALSWTASGEGQIYNDEAFTIHNAYDLMITLQPVFLVFTVIDKDEQGNVLNTMYYYGTAIITNINETGSVNNIASFNISFQGTGELSKDEDGAIYGNIPEEFQIIEESPDEPEPGLTELDFVWEAAIPEADDYTIRIVNNSDGTTAYQTGGSPGNTMAIDVFSDNNYSFSIRSNYYDGTAHSEWSDEIDWPTIPTDDSEFMEDSDGVLMIDSDNQTMEDN